MESARFKWGEFLRFGWVALLGFCVDITIAWALSTWLGLPLTLAIIFGFAAGAIFNYILHEFWTFYSQSPQLSMRRSGQYLTVLCVTLLVRLGIASGLSITFDSDKYRLGILICAVGSSFMANYLLSSFFVFSNPTKKS